MDLAWEHNNWDLHRRWGLVTYLTPPLLPLGGKALLSSGFRLSVWPASKLWWSSGKGDSVQGGESLPGYKRAIGGDGEDDKLFTGSSFLQPSRCVNVLWVGNLSLARSPVIVCLHGCESSVLEKLRALEKLSNSDMKQVMRMVHVSERNSSSWGSRGDGEGWRGEEEVEQKQNKRR